MGSKFTTPRKSQALKTAESAGKKQTSLFSFFASPKGVANLNVAINEEDGSFNDDDLPMDDDILKDIEMAEEEYAKSPLKPRAKPAAGWRPRMMMPMTDDDDADGTFVPEELSAATRSSGRNGRVIDDSDDSDYGTPLSLSAPKRSTGDVMLKTPSKRQRLHRGTSTATTSCDEPSLMTLLNRSQAPCPTHSIPLMATLQSPKQSTLAVTANDARKERVAKFAKKNEERYAWLEDVKDAQGRTLFIPSSAWKKFSAFEKQYWEIKSKHWDTVVFFKKGKFYELYENDASIGSQEFDLKMTDRVNMRMAGVPESSFDHWVAQFIAKGYKVARVDQLESKLAKDMRERGSSKKGDGLENAEDVAASGTNIATSFGVAFFHMCSIKNDDADRSGLETLLVQINPREVVYRGVPSLTAVSLTKGSTSTSIMSLEQLSLSGPEAWDGMAGLSQPTWRALKNTCAPSTDWIALTARKEFWDLEQAFYFDEKASDMSTWPVLLRDAAENDTLALTALDKDLPMQNDTALVLDGPTISNLDFGGAAMSAASKIGTLFALLNHALTPRWTCHPLKSANVVEYLMSRGEVADTICTTLRSLADLERVLSRVHSGRCKVADFISLLEGLGAANELIAALPARLQSLLTMFPPIGDLLSQINAAFDQTMAANEGRLLPFPGADSEYDKVLVQLTELDAWFDQHLKENRKKFNSKSIDYKHMGKEPYQLEMPVSVKVPDSYFKLSGTKAVNRYWSPELRTKVQERAEALETKSMVLDSYQTRLYAKFDLSVVSELDCLVALTVASSSLGMPLCRPEILEPADNCGGYIRVPPAAGAISDFVANDIVLGRHSESSMMSSGDQDDGASMILLTGPNMGGKSTLLRQLCLGVILAQLGCYVPAQSARITPVDRLFTRIGARDHLLAGRSTFMVEMAETATILRYATPHSLVVLDELGRGTSTHDGEAVAFGVLHGLCARLGCLGLFSTHYGLLAESLLKGITSKSSGTVEPHLRPMFMACAVNEEEHRVTFLYRLTRGVASKSHGMNVAAMAGVPVSIVKQANEVAEKFEHGVKQRQKVRQMDVDVDESDDMMPLALQSDFANLLRMAALESKRGGRNAEHNEPVGGVAGAQRANENQYWPCIVNHLRRIMH
ncbi:hypothetical protein DL89DRAFT_266906 [Linderina pennispora]|uniref:DNA mismatch repair protein n=1 Tax=Linderina pennispora TaxID=61395 RepID=A0A1Y1WC92_9FUNG|nr:uncharacterized protein DL89DRAFT_266906 [Linderina pennispora]ORX70774.1 hypothetical protein DL89DRAFT_266906 [Linderina pennispora]